MARCASRGEGARLGRSGQDHSNVFINGPISTEDKAILVEKSSSRDVLTPLRDNQTNPSNPTFPGKILALDAGADDSPGKTPTPVRFGVDASRGLREKRVLLL